jgi:hypothetical protein
VKARLHLDGVTHDTLPAIDELHPPLPAAAEDMLPSAMDSQPPFPNVVASEHPTFANEMLLLVVVEDDVVPIATDTVNSASSEAPEDGAGGIILTDELRAEIIKQVCSLRFLMRRTELRPNTWGNGSSMQVIPCAFSSFVWLGVVRK